MPTFSSILVPLDGSSFAEDALPPAIQLARESGATLVLVLVHTPVVAWNVPPEALVTSPVEDSQVRKRELAYLESLAARVRTKGTFKVFPKVLDGEVTSAIQELVRQVRVDLVVMASHRRAGMGRLLLGNVADSLVRTLPVPILVVRKMKSTGGAWPWPSRILVPLDGSALAESVLEQTKAIVRLLDGEIILASVLQTVGEFMAPGVFSPDVQEPFEIREMESRSYLERVKTRLQVEGLRVQTRLRVAANVARELVELAREERCGLITIATHGEGGLNRLMFGSVTDQIVRHAAMSVLILHPAAELLETSVAAATCDIQLHA